MSTKTRAFLTTFGLMMLAAIVAPAVAKADACTKYDLYTDNAGHAVCMNTGVDCTVCTRST